MVLGVHPFPGLTFDRVVGPGFGAELFALGWAPDGKWLATGSKDKTVRLWTVAGQPIATLDGHQGTVLSVAFSPDRPWLASGSVDHSIRLWDTGTLGCIGQLVGHTERVTSLAWSPDGRFLVSGSDDRTVRCWAAFEPFDIGACLSGHTAPVNCVAVSPGSVAASASFDRTVRLWDLDRVFRRPTIGEPKLVLRHPGWRCDLWLPLGSFLEETTSLVLSIGISQDNVLATYTLNQRAIRLSRLDPRVLLAGSTTREQYCNAKVVIVGDSGVGKSGLALALAGRPFSATESTHVRTVWQLDERVVELEPDLRETREILLWDLAGQPTYRMIHQLHLHDTTVAIIVFDARTDTDPMRSVRGVAFGFAGSARPAASSKSSRRDRPRRRSEPSSSSSCMPTS